MEDINPAVVVMLLLGSIFFAELIGPEIGLWAVWLGRIVFGFLLIFMVYMALGGGGFGTLVLSIILLAVAGGIWLLIGGKLVSSLSKIARVVVPILMIIDLIFAIIDISVGFRNGDSILIFAGGFAGLMALASSPVVSEPTPLAMIMGITGLVIGTGAMFKEAAYDAFG